MKNYEALIIFPPQIMGDLLQPAKKSFEDQVTSRGGKIVSWNEIGLRSLGYSVKKQSQGYVVDVALQLAPEQISDLQKTIQLNENFLKFSIVVKADAKKRVERAKKKAHPRSVPAATRS